MFHGLRALFTYTTLGLLLMFGLTFVGVAMTGPTVKEAERTVLVLGVVDLALAALLLTRFVRASASFARGLGRWVWSVFYAALLAASVVVVFMLTVMSLNR